MKENKTRDKFVKVKTIYCELENNKNYYIQKVFKAELMEETSKMTIFQ